MASIRPHGNKWRVFVEKHGCRVSKLLPTEDEARLWAAHVVQELDAKKAKYSRPTLVANGPELVTFVPRMVLDAGRMLPHPHAHILESAIATRRASGVYFLLREREVVYVGQSVDVLHRIARHRREGKVFDAFTYMESEPADMDRLESLYIKAFMPEENLSFGNRERKQRLGERTREPRSEPTADSSA